MSFPKHTLLHTGILTVLTMVALWSVVDAAPLTYIRDLIKSSAPGASTHQTITFTLNQAIPAGGRILLDFSGGGFTLPALNFNYLDVDLGSRISTTTGFAQRQLFSSQTAVTDRVAVTSGTSGAIQFDLNTTTGIAAGAEVEIKIGTNAIGTTNNTNMILTNATGSYPVTIRTYAPGAVPLDYGQTRIMVIEQVTVAPVDTTDQDPPIILEALPSGILQYGTVGVQMYVRTNEVSRCRYATSSMQYDVMPYSLVGTTTGLVFLHFADISGLSNGETYDYYIRCIDYRLNEIDPDYVLTFTVGIPPGTATTTATSTSTGTGDGTSTSTATSTGTSDMGGTDTGTGTGGSGSGSGSSASGGDGSGSGSGGGGGDGEGTQLPQADVRIDGYAYPGATVAFIRDGVMITDKAADGGGEFSNLTEGLDRGSYTFGVYATDSNGVRSATFSTTLWLQSDTLNVLSNIMLPPTVSVIENSVDPGTPLAVSGYSAPNAEITTWLRPKLAQVSSGDIVSTTTAASNGLWSLTISTTGLSQGTYELVAQGTIQDGLIESDKSARKTIGIGVDVADDTCLSRGDLNCDGFVNLVDFSILLFNWNTASVVADINGDGLVSLPDFSIMLYNWTG